MSKEQLRKELHALIDQIDNEQVLSNVMEDIVAYQKEQTGFDDLSDLSEEDRAELEESFDEDPEKDTITYEEFLKNIQAWRSALLQRRDLQIK